jgi:hypothetical protein
MCEFEKARFFHISTNKSVLRYKSLEKLNSTNQADYLRGFKFYFEAYSLTDTPSSPSSTKQTFTRTTPSSYTRSIQ